MKRFKKAEKVLALLLAIILVFCLTACGGGQETAEKAAANMLEAIKKADQETASRYIDYGVLSGMGDSAQSGSESEELVKMIFGSMEYNILSSEENGDEADIKAEITNVDMSAAIQDIFTELIALALSGEELNEEEMSEKMMEVLKSKLSDEATARVTNEVTIHMTRTDGQWKADTEETLLDALTGGMLSMENMF